MILGSLRPARSVVALAIGRFGYHPRAFERIAGFWPDLGLKQRSLLGLYRGSLIALHSTPAFGGGEAAQIPPPNWPGDNRSPVDNPVSALVVAFKPKVTWSEKHHADLLVLCGSFDRSSE
jgi:hypothetical protein